MAQQTIFESLAKPVEKKAERKVDKALTVCKKCEHLVPKTMVCLYCGAPILFRSPEDAE